MRANRPEVVELWQGGPPATTSSDRGPRLQRAVDAFVATFPNAGTRRAYAGTWEALLEELGSAETVAVLQQDQYAERFAEAFTRRWDDRAPATWNRHLDAVRSGLGYWREQGWITGDPSIRLARRRVSRHLSKAIDRIVLERFLDRRDLPLRDKLLFRMLYETAARAAEILRLDVEDLDAVNRRAQVVRKRGAMDIVVWKTGTARLLPRYLKGRTTGPLFVTDRRARVELGAGDLDEHGRARLSYRRLGELLDEHSAGQPGGPWDPHQLRHSALTHDAEDGASTPILLGRSGHTSVKSLQPYTRISAEALGQWQRDHDPARR